MTDEVITLAHGAGGEASRELVEQVFLPAFGNEMLCALQDAAVCTGAQRIAMTTDSFVVKPLFFPGGDVGHLSICGTVNDLAVSGARPKYLSVGMILEAGLPMEKLKSIVSSMAQTAKRAGVQIVTGDTKVTTKGGADEIIINTAGVGVFDEEHSPLAGRASEGDVILCSGPLGSHGMAVMCARNNITFTPAIQSDAVPLYTLAHRVCTAAQVHAMRDPTRGGAAATVCEWASAGDIDIELDEQALPVRGDVRAACELLGFDVLHVANEGVLLMAVPQSQAQAALQAARADENGTGACIIGRVKAGNGTVTLRTEIGTLRRVTLPRGELLPRIC